ncbi:hypothetical protein Tco_0971613 [Tanacetum coccineum]
MDPVTHGPSDAMAQLLPSHHKSLNKTLVLFLTEDYNAFLSTFSLRFDESDTYVLERFDTSAGNHVKEILHKLNLPDHRILKDGGEGEDLPVYAYEIKLRGIFTIRVLGAALAFEEDDTDALAFEEDDPDALAKIDALAFEMSEKEGLALVFLPLDFENMNSLMSSYVKSSYHFSKLFDGPLLDTMSGELYTISSELLVSKEDGLSVLRKSELLSEFELLSELIIMISTS